LSAKKWIIKAGKRVLKIENDNKEMAWQGIWDMQFNTLN